MTLCVPKNGSFSVRLDRIVKNPIGESRRGIYIRAAIFLFSVDKTAVLVV